MNFEFRRPLGLVLMGGGSMGAWQAGALARWSREGLEFDRILGLSIGAMNGACYALGLMDYCAERWNTNDIDPVLALSPRSWLRKSLFSDRPIRSRLAPMADDAAMRRRALCSFYSVTYDRTDGAARVSSFEPRGRWDAPLLEHVAASSAIPGIFPAVTVDIDGRPHTLVDGGVSPFGGRVFDPLRGCADVVLVSTVEPGAERAAGRGPWDRVNGLIKRALFSQLRAAARTLGRWEERPRLFCVAPSRALDQFVLDFSGDTCRRGFAQGLEDGSAFVMNPGAALESEAAGAEPSGAPAEPGLAGAPAA